MLKSNVQNFRELFERSNIILVLTHTSFNSILFLLRSKRKTIFHIKTLYLTISSILDGELGSECTPLQFTTMCLKKEKRVKIKRVFVY